MDLNTCYELTKDVHTVVYYTHLVPLTVAFLLSIYFLIKTKYGLVSRVFFYLIFAFNFWIVCDLVTWTTKTYDLVGVFWSLFDYVNVIFYLFGLYFLMVVRTQKDINHWYKLIGFAITLPAFWFVATGNAVHVFDQPTCGNDFGNNYLTLYKSGVEIFVMATIIVFSVWTTVKEKNKEIKHQVNITAAALLLFFGTFTVTDYLSVQTNIYQIGLYGLFAMPFFLGLIVYSVVKYKTFNIKLLGAQALVGAVLALVGAQFFFISDTTSVGLNIATLVFVSYFGYLLVQSVKREVEARQKIEKLATDLQKANEGQTNLIHIMNHQIKGYLAKARGIFSELLSEPAYGPVSDVAKPMIKEGFDSLTEGVGFVQQVLNGSSAESGTLQYIMKPLDFKVLVSDVASKQKENATKKGLTFDLVIDEGSYMINADAIHMKEAVRNLIDNSIIYTPTGGLTILLSHKSGMILLAIKDTGIGIADHDREKLFTKGGRGKDSLKVNVNSTGYGLAFVKGVVNAHGGKVWVESEGTGKGSTFYIELSATA